MRYVTAVYRPPSGQSFHATGQALADADGVTREYVHSSTLQADETVTAIVSVRGDECVAEAALQDVESVNDVAVANPPGGAALVYVHHDANDLVTRMMEARRTTRVVMDMPIVVRESGAYEVTYLGTDAAFADALGQLSDVEMDVLETGTYTPRRRDAFDSLTDRQQEVVAAAVRLGYYRSPREATHEDVADATGCSSGTVGEHLRKAEARVFSQFVVTE